MLTMQADRYGHFIPSADSSISILMQLAEYDAFLCYQASLNLFGIEIGDVRNDLTVQNSMSILRFQPLILFRCIKPAIEFCSWAFLKQDFSTSHKKLYTVACCFIRRYERPECTKCLAFYCWISISEYKSIGRKWMSWSLKQNQ